MGIMMFMESMGTSNVPLLAAFFIGLMTAISPCPLATNITAIAYASKRIDNSKHTLLVGLLYTLGRMLTYVSIASSIVWAGVSSQTIALFLQQHGERILGPFLIIIGILMLDLVKLHLLQKSDAFSAFKERLANKGYAGAFLLGVVFALAFCPFSAVLFFGMLIPLAINAGDGILIPAVFAIATGLPVIIFAFILVKSVGRLGTVLNRVQTFEKWTRRLVAVAFILVGIYYTVQLVV